MTVAENLHPVHIWLEDDILHCSFDPHTKVTIDIAKYMVSKRMEIAGNKLHPICGDYRNVSYLDKEARDYFSSEEGQTNLTAGALIINSSLTKVIVNFYLTLTKPRLPARMFTDLKEATSWLEQYKNKP